ncbi:GMC oxidoreductase-domain-containing protein [Mycena metata]|uniref:GMC oxidoreductase-domain-containing protein n=1 Tax=Mycena metata TaxID=1033252 RepID=A0AAD7H4K7_9AGAR|nr:GMC oxidoreductase-domain-containing protein [Mycena metata]
MECTCSCIDRSIKMRPRPDELAEPGPEFMDHRENQFAHKPDKPLFWLSAVAAFLGDPTVFPSLNYMTSAAFLGYPASRGHLHISTSDPYATPDFLAGFLSSPVDVTAMRWAYKKGRELNRRLPSYRGACFLGHPKFPPGDIAAMEETHTVPIDAPKIVYSAEDDQAIDAYLRQVIQTAWHSLGTCAMKPLEQGVVDSKLNVYGVKNFKVADLSIPPSNVNSNTCSAAIAIGEKAAVIIANELGGSV